MKIQNLEFLLEMYIKDLETKYNPIFNDKSLDFSAELEIDGTDHFQPGYCSSIYVGVSDELTVVNLYKLPIWKCEQILFGLPVSKPVPFSKMVGELVEENLEELKDEIKQNCKDMLSEQYL